LILNTDGEWRALRNDEIVKAIKHLGAVYRAELAHELQRLGYGIRHEKGGLFELAHISREQLERFSRRSQQVEQRLAENGLSRETATPEQRQQATMQTRRKKEAAVDRAQLHARWRGRARELGIDFNRREWASPEARGPSVARDGPPSAQLREVAEEEAARRAVRYAINHLTERQAVVEENNLVEAAVTHAIGAARPAAIEHEIQRQTEKGFLIREAPAYRAADAQDRHAPGKTRAAWVEGLVEQGQDLQAARRQIAAAIERGSLVSTEARYTTQTALEREKRILQIERDGRGQVAPVLPAEAASERLAGAKLNRGQHLAAHLMLTTPNRVIGVQGFAGVGKSHMLDTAKDLIERSGYKVRALAPYGSQVKALRELGVEARTVASFLHAKNKDIEARTVLVIDEAGVMPTRMMEKTLQIAEKAGARVVLMGDVAQTKAIEAGRPFDQLQAHGMRTAHMEEIQRQKNPELKAAVEMAARGNAAGSLQRIETVLQIESHHERRAAVAQHYVSLAPEDRASTLIVSGTNEARREINEAVREGLGLAGKGTQFDTLLRVDATREEQRYSRNYAVGQVIQPERDYPKTGLQRGELYHVADTGPGNRLTVRAATDGREIVFSPMTHTKISVYDPERAELAPGDVVRVTRQDAGLDLANGDRLKVLAVAPHGVKLTDGRRELHMSTDRPLHLDHAYASTVHGAQGLTTDRVLIDAQSTSRTTAKDVYYVAISRARHEAVIYTDDASKLPTSVMRDNVKTAALDLERGSAAMQRHLVQRAYETGQPQMHFGPGQSSVNPGATGAASQRSLVQRAHETGQAQVETVHGQKRPGLTGPEMGA
jgi:ATP-dependent exoDNAse (exonuclease V) alpha subunit